MKIEKLKSQDTNITSFDELAMRRCFELAELGAGNISPNPKVGAVISHKGKIIGEGFHQKYGEGHAEVNAIQSVTPQDLSKLKEATIYVSLEPCFHFGKTPPCVDLILKHQIPSVVIAMQDPTSKVGGQSIEKLRASGVKVQVGVLEAEARQLIRRFTQLHIHERPYIILKWAQSADGFIGKPNEQVWLSNPISKRLVHQWRAEEGAILVGTNTAIVDNPQLTTRLYFGKSPLRLVIDKNHKIPRGHRLFSDGLPTIYFTRTTRTDFVAGIEQVLVKDWNELLPQIITSLKNKKKHSLIVEGGAQLLQSFINRGLWDEARVFKTKKVVEQGIQAPQISYSIKNSWAIGQDQLDILRANKTL